MAGVPRKLRKIYMMAACAEKKACRAASSHFKCFFTGPGCLRGIRSLANPWPEFTSGAEAYTAKLLFA
ncbi:hypothetical protein, partial [Methylobacterium soli]|uniref:hypothetical protein n=1 Tax=Methylobacterium soli TaxID=553447 RepID=UPI001EE2EFD8